MEDQQDLTTRIKNCIKQDNFREALRLSSAHSSDKGNYFFKYYVGLSHKLLGQIEEALAVFEDFEEEQFQNIEKQLKIDLLQNMAEIYQNKQLYHKSTEYFIRLLELDKSKPSSFNSAILSLIKLNRINEAEAIALKGIEKFPCDQELVINLAKCYKIEKRNKEAIQLLKQFISNQNQPDCNVQLILSDIYYDEQMYDEYTKLNQSILDLDKNNVQALANQAKFKINNLCLHDTYSICKNGLKINADFALFYYYAGQSQHLSACLDQAITYMEMACTLDQNKSYEFTLSLIVMYIEKGYLTQDFQWFDSSYQLLQRLDGDEQSRHLSDNPIFQYLNALILRLIKTPEDFQNYWQQIFHIQTVNLTPVSRHPSQDFYESLDKTTQDLIGLIQQLDFFSKKTISNQKIELEIENQKTLIYFYILKTISTPSSIMKKYKQYEIQQLMSSIFRYQEIFSNQFQQSNQLVQQLQQSQIFEQQIHLNINEIQGLAKQKKDKEYDEFFQKFFDIIQSVIDFTNEQFKKGLKLNEKIQNLNQEQQKLIVIISTVELEEYKKLDNISVEDLLLPQKLRKIFDLIQIGSGKAFKQAILNCYNALDKKLIKTQLSNKSALKSFIVQLNSYKNGDQLFNYKTPSDALAYDYVCKFFSTLLMDNLTDIKYQSYYIQYLQTTTQAEQTNLLLDILKSIETYNPKNMQQSYIKSQKVQKNYCNIF